MCLLGHLDIQLADRMIHARQVGVRLFQMREARDFAWMVGALGGLCIHVTHVDIADCLRRRAGRFRPGQHEFFLIHGLRTVIDYIDELAEAGTRLSPTTCRGIYERVTQGIEGHGSTTLRQGAVRDVIPGMSRAAWKSLPDLFSGLCLERGFLHDPMEFQQLHPVEQAARIFQRVSKLAPFPDFNLLVASLCSSLHLLGYGYPPFLPRACDRKAILHALRSSPDQLSRLFAGIVFRGFEEFSLSG